MSERSRGEVAAHSSCTAHAASKAAIASSSPAEARVAITSPVAGFSTSKVAPSFASTHSPLINRPVGTLDTTSEMLAVIYITFILFLDLIHTSPTCRYLGQENWLSLAIRTGGARTTIA